MALLGVLALLTASAVAAAPAKTPDFSITSTAQQSVAPGQSGVYSVSVAPLNGFTGSVSLSVSGLPTGATGTFVTNPLTVGSSTVMTSLIVTTSSSTPTGTYALTITGASGSLVHTVSPKPSLAVVPPSAFTLAVSPTSQSVAAGSSGTLTVTATRLSGFTGAITFSTNSDLPAGVTASFSPNPTSTTGSTSTLTLTVASSVPVGSYWFAINGVNGGHSTWVAATLNVTAPPPDFSLSATSSQTAVPGQAGVYTVTMTPLRGFSGSVTLAVSGLPKSSQATFVTNPLSNSKASTSMIVETGSAVLTGTYPLTITGTSGSLSHTASAALVIASSAPFTLDQTQTVNSGVTPGSATSWTVQVLRSSGFTGAVTLSTNSDLPAGVTVSFSPNPVSGSSSTITVQTSASTPLGSYPFAIHGVSGSSSTWIRATLNVGSYSLSAAPTSRYAGPVTSATYTVSVNRTAYFTANVTLSVSAGLPANAIASFSPNPVLGPSGSTSTLTIQTPASVAEGPYTLTISGSGGSPTQTKTTTVTLIVDKTAPTTTISFPTNNGAYNTFGWSNNCVGPFVTGICGGGNDASSGVATIKVAIRNSANQYWNGSAFVSSFSPIFNLATGTTDWSYSLTPPADGSYTALVQATDAVGNTTPSGLETQVTFKYDTTPPATTLTTSPLAPDSNGWFRRASVQFTLNASDATSGVAASYYSIDGASAVTYGGPVTINSQGAHTVEYWSVDVAGNIEQHHTVQIKLDNVAPSTAIALNPASANGSGGWYTSTPTFTLTATDAASGIATSGVATTSYRVDSGPTQTYTAAVSIPDGTHTISYWSTDNAGNTETTHLSDPVKVDTVAPTTNFAIIPASPSGLNGWYKAPAPKFTLTGSDSTSGVAATYYKIGNGAQQLYSGQVTLPDGQYSISYWSVDVAGNTEGAEIAGPFKVDASPPPVPSITAHPQDPSNQPTAYFTFTDTESVSFRCALDAASLAPCGSPQDFSGLGEGSHSFTVEATDQAGNTSTSTFTWKIQAVPYTIGAAPIATLYPGGPASKINLTFANPNGDTIKVSSLTVSISSIDGGSNTPNTCTAADYQVSQFSGSYPFYLPVGSSSLQSNGFAESTWPTIRMLDYGNQDGCKGATVHLDFGGNS